MLIVKYRAKVITFFEARLELYKIVGGRKRVKRFRQALKAADAGSTQETAEKSTYDYGIMGCTATRRMRMKMKVRDCWTACQNGTTRCGILSTRSDTCCVVLWPVNIRQYAKLSSAAGGRVVTVKAVQPYGSFQTGARANGLVTLTSALRRYPVSTRLLRPGAVGCLSLSCELRV